MVTSSGVVILMVTKILLMSGKTNNCFPNMVYSSMPPSTKIENNLRLVPSKEIKLCLELFLYTKDKAKIVHGQRDFESVFKNNLRYLYFINQFLGCGTSSSCIGNEIRNNDTESFGREK